MTSRTVTGEDLRRVREIVALGALEPGPPPSELRAMLDLVRRVIGVSGAALNIITDDAQHAFLTSTDDPLVCDREDSLCAAVLDEPAVSLSDVGEDPRFTGNPYVDGRLAAVRFYASAPLMTSEGVVVGRLCAFDLEPREVPEEDLEVLQVLADRVVDILELRRRTHALERANERLSEFASQVSHDLHSPLAAMSLLIRLARDRPDHVVDLLDRAHSVTGRMVDQIDGILRAARDEAHPRHESVDLERVLDGVRADVGAVLEATGGTLTHDALPTVCGDEAQLHSLLVNLVSNALKFTRPDAPPRVHVTARRERTSYVVEVLDEGRGVAPHQRDRVFGRFDRGDGGTGDVPGHGIGLATARRVVEEHGGSITLGPREDGRPGTSVRVVLPG